MIVGQEIYVGGKKTGTPEEIEKIRDATCERGGMAWVLLKDPSVKELESVASEFDFHPLAVEDAIEAHQRPKVERYEDTLFVVLRSACYLDRPEKLEFGEIHLFVGNDFVVTVCHGDTESLEEVKERLEGDPDLLKHGPLAVLYAVMDYLVDGYAPVLEGLENDIDEVETEVFGGNASNAVSRRIYGLSQQVLLLHRITAPLAEALQSLIGEREVVSEREIIRYLRDVHDHSLRVNDRTENLRETISNILSVNLAIIGANQNDQTKKISAWAAILVVPTIITGIYGMNFRRMPELHWTFGYPYALALMLCISVGLYLLFKRRGWL